MSPVEAAATACRELTDLARLLARPPALLDLTGLTDHDVLIRHVAATGDDRLITAAADSLWAARSWDALLDLLSDAAIERAWRPPAPMLLDLLDVLDARDETVRAGQLLAFCHPQLTDGQLADLQTVEAFAGAVIATGRLPVSGTEPYHLPAVARALLGRSDTPQPLRAKIAAARFEYDFSFFDVGAALAASAVGADQARHAGEVLAADDPNRQNLGWYTLAENPDTPAEVWEQFLPDDLDRDGAQTIAMAATVSPSCPQRLRDHAAACGRPVRPELPAGVRQQLYAPDATAAVLDQLRFDSPYAALFDGDCDTTALLYETTLWANLEVARAATGRLWQVGLYRDELQSSTRREVAAHAAALATATPLTARGDVAVLRAVATAPAGLRATVAALAPEWGGTVAELHEAAAALVLAA